MKRDTEIFRQLLLDLEAGETKNSFTFDTILKLSSNKDVDAVGAHFRLMVDAGFLISFTDHYGHTQVNRYSISNRGYDFLESVRDDEVWRKTKSAVAEIKGFTLDLVGDIAKGFLKTQLKRLTGVDVQS